MASITYTVCLEVPVSGKTRREANDNAYYEAESWLRNWVTGEGWQLPKEVIEDVAIEETQGERKELGNGSVE